MKENQDNLEIFNPKKRKKSKKAKKKVKPGFCPYCGAYVGAFYTCKWCGEKMPHGTRLRIFQILSVIGAIIGLIFLGMYAQVDPAPKVNIGDIGPTYSNAAVTIKGEITDMDYYEAEDNSWKVLILTITDDTGSIDVKAYTEVIEELIQTSNGGEESETYRTPALGDDCEIRGSVYVKGDDLHLMLESRKFLTVSRKIEFPSNGSSIRAPDFFEVYQEHLNERVYVNGTVGEVNTEESFFMINTTKEENMKVTVPIYAKIFNPDMSLSVLSGSKVRVKGICGEYKVGGPQITVGSMTDIEGGGD